MIILKKNVYIVCFIFAFSLISGCNIADKSVIQPVKEVSDIPKTTNGNIKIEMVTADSINTIQENNSLTDTEKVKQIIESVLTAKLMVENHFIDFDFLFIQNNPNNDNYSINFFNKKVKLFKEVKKYHNNNITDKTDEDISYNFYNIQVSDNKVLIKVTQTYNFHYVGNSQLSGIETTYEINLVKKSDKWLIDGIRSDEIFEQVYYKTDFDYDTKLKEMTTAQSQNTKVNNEIKAPELDIPIPKIDYPSTYPKFEITYENKSVDWIRGDANFTGKAGGVVGNTNFGADENVAGKLMATKVMPGSIIKLKADEVEGLDKPEYEIFLYDKSTKNNLKSISGQNEFSAPNQTGEYLFLANVNWGKGDNSISYWFKIKVEK